jgi:hypothetical protein
MLPAVAMAGLGVSLSFWVGGYEGIKIQCDEHDDSDKENNLGWGWLICHFFSAISMFMFLIHSVGNFYAWLLRKHLPNDFRMMYYTCNTHENTFIQFQLSSIKYLHRGLNIK